MNQKKQKKCVKWNAILINNKVKILYLTKLKFSRKQIESNVLPL